MPEQLLTSKELAKMLGMSEASVFRHVREGKPGFPVPLRSGTRYTRFRLSHANAFIDSLATTGVAPRPAKPAGVTPPWAA